MTDVLRPDQNEIFSLIKLIKFQKHVVTNCTHGVSLKFDQSNSTPFLHTCKQVSFKMGIDYTYKSVFINKHEY